MFKKDMWGPPLVSRNGVGGLGEALSPTQRKWKKRFDAEKTIKADIDKLFKAGKTPQQVYDAVTVAHSYESSRFIKQLVLAAYSKMKAPVRESAKLNPKQQKVLDKKLADKKAKMDADDKKTKKDRADKIGKKVSETKWYDNPAITAKYKKIMEQATITELEGSRFAVVDKHGKPVFISADSESADRVAKQRGLTVRPIFSKKPFPAGAIPLKQIHETAADRAPDLAIVKDIQAEKKRKADAAKAKSSRTEKNQKDYEKGNVRANWVKENMFKNVKNESTPFPTKDALAVGFPDVKIGDTIKTRKSFQLGVVTKTKDEQGTTYVYFTPDTPDYQLGTGKPVVRLLKTPLSNVTIVKKAMAEAKQPVPVMLPPKAKKKVVNPDALPTRNGEFVPGTNWNDEELYVLRGNRYPRKK